MAQTGPRNDDAVQASRYWLTPAGWSAAAAAQAAIASGQLAPTEEIR